MTVYVIIGRNEMFNNVSARAAYSTREAAEAHLLSDDKMWFDDAAVIVELELDATPIQSHLIGPVGDDGIQPKP
jgi:hypothetical protein